MFRRNALSPVILLFRLNMPDVRVCGIPISLDNRQTDICYGLKNPSISTSQGCILGNVSIDNILNVNPQF